MAGLTLLLETQKSRVSKKSTAATPQILSKADMVRLCRAAPRRQVPATAASASAFLEACYLCRKRLSPEKDIYMYRGDRAFCSVECRLRQISMDDEESMRRTDKCGLYASAASSPATSAAATAASSSSSSPARQRKGGGGGGGAKARPAGVAKAGFAY